MQTTCTEIAPGICTFDHAVAEGKNVVIFSDRGAWAVDTGTHRAEGAAMLEFIRARGHTPDRLIYTHGHPDHVLGSQDFRDALVIAHALTPVEMRRLLPVWAARAETTADALAAQLAWPTVLFPATLNLDLGNLHVHIFPTPGHSQDGVSLYVREHKLLIAGDAVVTGIVPAIGDGDGETLVHTLRHLHTLDIDILVPGHGPVIYGTGEVKNWLTWLADYLQGVRIFVQGALDSGLDDEAIVAMVDYDRFVGDRLPAARHNMLGRHRATVAKILSEEKRQRGQR